MSVFRLIFLFVFIHCCFHPGQSRTAQGAFSSKMQKCWALKHLAPWAARRKGMLCSLMDSEKKKAYDPVWVLLAKLFPITQNPFLYSYILFSTINVPTRSLAKPSGWVRDLLLLTVQCLPAVLPSPCSLREELRMLVFWS